MFLGGLSNKSSEVSQLIFVQQISLALSVPFFTVELNVITILED